MRLQNSSPRSSGTLNLFETPKPQGSLCSLALLSTCRDVRILPVPRFPSCLPSAPLVLLLLGLSCTDPFQLPLSLPILCSTSQCALPHPGTPTMFHCSSAPGLLFTDLAGLHPEGSHTCRFKKRLQPPSLLHSLISEIVFL